MNCTSSTGRLVGTELVVYSLDAKNRLVLSTSSDSQTRIQPKLFVGFLTQSWRSATMAGLEANVKFAGTVVAMMRFDWVVELEKSNGATPPGAFHVAGGNNRLVQVTALSFQSNNTLCKLNHRLSGLGVLTSVRVRLAEVTTALPGMFGTRLNLSKARFLNANCSGPSAPEMIVFTLPNAVSRLNSEIVASSTGVKVTMSAPALVTANKHAKVATVQKFLFWNSFNMYAYPSLIPERFSTMR